MPSKRACTLLALVMVSGLLVVESASYAAPLRGVWVGPVGPVKLRTKGGQVVGRLTRDSKVCSFKKGERVLDGALAFGNLSGKVRLCSKGCPGAGEHWAFSMLVVGKRRLSGAAAMKVAPGCSVPGRSAKGAVSFRRRSAGVKALSRPPLVMAKDAAPPEGTGEDGGINRDGQPLGPTQEGYDPKAAGDIRIQAMSVAREGEGFLQQGRFEEARKLFQKAVKLDPSYAEGFNGIGVSYALRRDWKEAARAYQQSIGANPDLGDAYYNLACAYAQTHKGDLAVRYLRIAVLNGYSEVKNLLEDPDLKPLQKRPDFKMVIKLGTLNAEGP